MADISYTKGILLEEITTQEYIARETFWGNNRRMDPFTVYCMISNPITGSGYETLMQKLLTHPNANELCVNMNGLKWVKRYANQIIGSEVKMMADIAARNPHKKNYLEIKLQRGLGRAPRAIIGFTEHEGKLVGYEVFLHNSLRDLFSIRTSRPYRFAAGLWVPPEYCSKTQDLLTSVSGTSTWQNQDAHTLAGAAAAQRST